MTLSFHDIFKLVGLLLACINIFLAGFIFKDDHKAKVEALLWAVLLLMLNN